MTKIKASPEELYAIEQAMNAEKRTRIYKRYRALYLYLSGKSFEKITEISGLCRSSAYRLVHVYRKEGLSGIPDSPRNGRPQRLSKQQEAALRDLILTKGPEDVGLAGETNWTATLIGEYIKREYGFDYSIRGITGMLKRLGLYYNHSTYVLTKSSKGK
jgi:putative transposase